MRISRCGPGDADLDMANPTIIDCHCFLEPEHQDPMHQTQCITDQSTVANGYSQSRSLEMTDLVETDLCGLAGVLPAKDVENSIVHLNEKVDLRI